MKTILFLFVLLTSFHFGYGQETNVNLIYEFQPKEAIVKLDGLIVESADTLTLSPGPHLIQAWHPKLELFEQHFNITADSLVTIVKGLQYSAAFYKYRDDLFKYNAKVSRLKKIPWLLTFGGSALIFSSSIIAYDIAELNEERALEQIDIYRASLNPGVITNSKNLFNDYKAKEKSFRTSANVLAVLGSAYFAYGIYKSIKLTKKANSMEKPVYKEDNPLAQLRVSPYLLTSTDQTLGLCLTLTF